MYKVYKKKKKHVYRKDLKNASVGHSFLDARFEKQEKEREWEKYHRR